MYRIQIATYGWLTDEILAETGDRAHAQMITLLQQKYCAGEAIGGGVIRLACLPRLWDVPVGDRIHPDKPIDDAVCAICSCAIVDHEDAYGRWHGCRGARAVQQPYTEADVTAIAHREGENTQADLLTVED